MSTSCGTGPLRGKELRAVLIERYPVPSKQEMMRIRDSNREAKVKRLIAKLELECRA